MSRALIRSMFARFRNADLLVLLALLVVVAGIWGFIELADEVIEGETHAIDNRMIRLLRNPADLSDPIGPPWFEEIARDLTALGGIAVLFLTTAAVAGYLLICRRYHAMWMVLIATAGGLLLSSLLKGSFDRPRPELVPHLSHVSSSSFPSGHSMMSAVVYLTLGSLMARLVDRTSLKLYCVGLALLITFLVGCSRVYMGVHYPSDVLAGWLAGLVWSVTCWLAARYLQRLGKVEPPT